MFFQIDKITLLLPAKIWNAPSCDSNIRDEGWKSNRHDVALLERDINVPVSSSFWQLTLAGTKSLVNTRGHGLPLVHLLGGGIILVKRGTICDSVLLFSCKDWLCMGNSFFYAIHVQCIYVRIWCPGFFFFSDLLRQIHCSVALVFMKITSFLLFLTA